MLDRRLRRYVGHGMLTQLAAFEAVVQLGGFTRAAEALHMAQPTVSVLVKKLGETLGVALFESTSREIRLTPAGAETYRFCQDFFHSLAGLDNHLTGLRSPTVSPLRIAVCTAAESLAPAMLCGFCERHPELRLILSVANRAQLLHRLAAAVDDFYIFGTPPAGMDVHLHPLHPDEMHIYASVSHPYAHRKKLSLAEIAHEPLLMREVGSGTRQIADELFARHGFQPYIRMEMDNNDAIKRAVAAGYGVALLSRYAVSAKPRHEALTRLRVEGLPIRREWQLVFRNDKTLSHTEQELLDEIGLQAARVRADDSAMSGANKHKPRKAKLFEGPTSADPIQEGSP